VGRLDNRALTELSDEKKATHRKLLFTIFYNVVWIEWEDGIAYRKALGRVFFPGSMGWVIRGKQGVGVVLGG
jgi:hypothetical protein